MQFTPIRVLPILVLGTVLSTALPAASSPAATSRAELDDRVEHASQVFRELRDTPDRQIPDDLIARSRCVAVVPNVLKAAWIFGGRYGRGILSCRTRSGEWSPPVHVMMTGGSFGLQFGASSTDIVLFFMTTDSVRSLLTNRVSLSGEAGVAAGPVGRETAAGTDGRFRAAIYSYARSRGLFLGISLAGGYLGVQREDTDAYYGQRYTTTGILFDGKVTSVPKSAWSFLSSLPGSRVATMRGDAPVAARSAASATAPTVHGPSAAAPVPAPVPGETFIGPPQPIDPGSAYPR
ncbi:MAG TPA: lipid-binding SYLF domain-containing protein [Candidatus Binatia bacterium]|jgi:lipid-binding SYLF domain-containing protein